MARYSNGESSFSRLARLLEAFGHDTPVVTVSELSQRTGIPLPTVSRMVSELVERGWLQRDGERRVWLGIRMWEMVARATPVRELRQVALPYMTELHARVGHHVQLSVRHGHDVVFTARLSTPDAVPAEQARSDRLPLHSGAPGLVLLAYAPLDVQEKVLVGTLTAFTERTVTDPRALRALLSDIRRSGMCYSPGTFEPATASIAVPIRIGGGQVVAALSAVVPNDDRARTAAPALRAAGARIHQALGDRRMPALTALAVEP
jgi:DNA-binding IclR family transcriptional regulator